MWSSKYRSSSSSKLLFLIIGSGTDFKKIETWFNKNKPTNAKLLSTLPESVYDKIVSISDVGLILLRNEFTIPNFPSRLLSYLENKKPTLSITDEVSDIGSISEEAGFGKWVKYGDLKSVIEKVIFFESNKTERVKMGELGYFFLIENYDVKISFNKINYFLTNN